MPISLLPASAAAFAPHSNVNVVLASKAEPWLTRTLKRVNRLLDGVRQHTHCLTETRLGLNAIWLLCSIMVPKAPDSNPLVEAPFNHQVIHIKAYVVHVDMASQHEVVFKLTQETIDALIEYRKDIYSVDVSASTWEWAEKEQQLKKLQDGFVQAVNRYVFRTDVKALEGLEEEGAGELLEGRGEDVQRAIINMLFSISNQALGLPWSEDSRMVEPGSYHQLARASTSNREGWNKTLIQLRSYGSQVPSKQEQKCSFCHRSFSASDKYREHIWEHATASPENHTITFVAWLKIKRYLESTADEKTMSWMVARAQNLFQASSSKSMLDLGQNNLTHCTAISNDCKSSWISTDSEVIPRSSQPYFPLDSWPQPGVSGSTSYLLYHMPQQDSMDPAVDSGAFNLTANHNNNNNNSSSGSSCESNNLSDSDSDTSCHNKPSSSKSSRTFHTTAYPRNQCEELIGPKRDTPCHKTFRRSEHLRRHIRTAHRDGHFHKCKIPSCDKTFKRRDNLSSHYLTHLNTKKNANKRANMVVEFWQLEKLLDPRERVLLKSLKAKLEQI